MPHAGAVTRASLSDWQILLRTLTSPDTYLDLGAHLAIILVIWLLAWAAIAVGRAAVLRAMTPLVESEIRRDHLSAAARQRTLVGLFISFVRYIIFFIAVIGTLATWNVRFLGLLGTALGTAGILGVVVGFGAQKLVRDVITGFFILMEDQYALGDTITIGAITGVVEDVGIRITRIRDDIGRLNLIPNGDISQVTNHSRGRLEATVEVGVAIDQDMNQVDEVVTKAGEKLTAMEEGPVTGMPGVQGITAMDGTKATLRVVAMAAPGRQKMAELALRAALREEFLAAGIKMV